MQLGAVSPNEKVMRRLRILRDAVPFCERYRGEGIWCLPLGLVPTVDGTNKDIPRENLECDSDIAKNVVFRRAVESGYPKDRPAIKRSLSEPRKCPPNRFQCLA